jgi:hypothetical protein
MVSSAGAFISSRKDHRARVRKGKSSRFRTAAIGEKSKSAYDEGEGHLSVAMPHAQLTCSMIGA